MSEIASQAGKIVSSFTDRIIEKRFFMIIFSLILALDSFVLVFYQKGIQQSFLSFNAPETSLTTILIFLGLFSFVMSIFFPLFRQLLHDFFYYTGISNLVAIHRINLNDDTYSFASSVYQEALNKSNDILYKEVLAHRNNQKEIETNLNIVFSMNCLMLINILSSGETLSITEIILATIEGQGSIGFVKYLSFSFGLVLIFFLIIMLIKSLDPSRETRMYLPNRLIRNASSSRLN